VLLLTWNYSAEQTALVYPSEGVGMIKVSVLHESAAGMTFDLDYYLNQHIPQVMGRLGSACKPAGLLV